MTRKQKQDAQSGHLDIIDIDRFTKELDYRECEAGYVYNECKRPVKIASYLQTIYDGKATGTPPPSSSADLRRYEERLMDAERRNVRRKSGRRASDTSGRHRKGMRYPSDTIRGRGFGDCVHARNGTSYSSGDTIHCDEKSLINKYLEDIKRLERRYERVFKKQRKRISVLTDMCNRCLEQCSKMSQVVEHDKNINPARVEATGNLGRRGRELNNTEFHSVEANVKKASGDNIIDSDSTELLAVDKYYGKLAKKLEELKCYFDMKTSYKFESSICESCKKRANVSPDVVNVATSKSDHIVSAKKSDKAIATDFGKDEACSNVDDADSQESIQGIPNFAERPYIHNYFTNMYCSVILDKSGRGTDPGQGQRNAEETTDSGGPYDEEFGLRKRNWRQIALRVLHAGDAGRGDRDESSKTYLMKTNCPEMFPVSEETSAERLEAESGKSKIQPQMNYHNSSFNLDDPIKLYEQSRLRREFSEPARACKAPNQSICECLRSLCQKATAFCEQLLCCRQ